MYIYFSQNDYKIKQISICKYRNTYICTCKYNYKCIKIINIKVKFLVAALLCRKDP